MFHSDSKFDPLTQMWYCKKDWDDIHPHLSPVPLIRDGGNVPAHLHRPAEAPTYRVGTVWWEEATDTWETITAVNWDAWGSFEEPDL